MTGQLHALAAITLGNRYSRQVGVPKPISTCDKTETSESGGNRAQASQTITHCSTNIFWHLLVGGEGEKHSVGYPRFKAWTENGDGRIDCHPDGMEIAIK